MKTLKISLVISLVLLSLTGCTKKQVLAEYQVIPMPQSIIFNQAIDGFSLNSNTKIAYQAGNEVQKRTAEFLSDYIQVQTGIRLETTDESPTLNVIALRNEYESEKPEAYKININKDMITIDGSDDAGIFYGIQTLRKSFPSETDNCQIVFPAVVIEDFPRFEYRGMHLDVGRHMFPLEFIKKYIDILALHNINVFHWHITDDQGWRLEIKKYPELTQIGSMRAQTVIGKNTGAYDGTPYGGFYTQEEAKEVVAYAAERFITVIPEVDLPGHMEAALACYPNLGCTGGPYDVEQMWGVFDEVLCAGNEEIYVFLENVFAELIEIFPSEYIHVGGDECPKVRWETCPKCQAKIKELGLREDENHSKEQKLQSYVINRIEKFLNSKGRQIIGWDEILEGGLAPNATVMSWRGLEGGIHAAKMKHKAIIVPTSYCYFDYYQTDDIDNELFGIGGYVPVEKVYSLEPVSSELSEEESKYIIGVQANLWTEYVKTPEHAEYMVLPRMAALSEVQWSMPEKKDYESFLPRLYKYMQLYSKLGYNYATHTIDIRPEIETNFDNKSIDISLKTFDNAPIYYSLDGTEPTENSTKYEELIQLKTTTQLKAIAFRKDGKSKLFDKTFNFNKATMKDISLHSTTHPSYTYKGAGTLINGRRGGNSHNNGEWLGFLGTDFHAEIDLGELMDISMASTGILSSPSSWIFAPKKYVVEISEDGETFTQVFEEEYPDITPTNPAHGIVDLTAQFDTQKARFVRLTIVSTQPIPDWHPGKGGRAFLFVDEIIIE